MKKEQGLLLIFSVILISCCSCIGPVQRHLEAEKEDCLEKNRGREGLCESYYQQATQQYTREPKYVESEMTLEEYNSHFRQSLVALRKKMGLR